MYFDKLWDFSDALYAPNPPMQSHGGGGAAFQKQQKQCFIWSNKKNKYNQNKSFKNTFFYPFSCDGFPLPVFCPTRLTTVLQEGKGWFSSGGKKEQKDSFWLNNLDLACCQQKRHQWLMGAVQWLELICEFASLLISF